MAYDDLRSLLRALEREGDLKRIKAEVDPYLEVGEIVDRVNKAGGPALLFENVRGSDMPLAMNVYGTDRRLLKALGLKSYAEISEKIGGLLKPRAAARVRRRARGLREARRDDARTAEEGEDLQRARARGRPHRRRRGPGPAPRAVHLAQRRRLLLQPGPHPHQGPGHRHPQPRPVPPPAPRPAHHRHALADPQGQPQPLPGRRPPRRAPAGRHRLRLPAGRDLRLHRAAARRHRRVPLRRVPPGQADRDGRLQDRSAPGARAGRGRDRRLAGARRDAPRGPLRRPHRLLHPAGTVPRPEDRLRDDAEAPAAPVDRGRPAPDRGRPPGQGHGTLLPPAPQDHRPGHRGLPPPRGRRLPQLRDRLDRQEVPEARAEGHARRLGRAHDVPDQADRGRRLRLRRPRPARGRLAGARQHRLRPRPTVVEGPVDHLDHASYQQFWGGKAGIDATKKLPEEGYTRDGGWPDMVLSDPDTAAKVDRRWKEYGL
ncbi:3-octaprenyl-4-hydroxybenzoate carboxy-lyase [Streptomyces tendae]